MHRRDISIAYKIQLSKSNVGRTHPNWFWCWCRCWCVFHEKHPDDNGRRGKGGWYARHLWVLGLVWKMEAKIKWNSLADTKRPAKGMGMRMRLGREMDNAGRKWQKRVRSPMPTRRIVMLMSWRLRAGVEINFKSVCRSNSTELNQTDCRRSIRLSAGRSTESVAFVWCFDLGLPCLLSCEKSERETRK